MWFQDLVTMIINFYVISKRSILVSYTNTGLQDQSQNLGRKIKINNFEGC